MARGHTFHTAAKLPLGLVLAALLAACATPLSQDDLERELRRAGASVPGMGRNFLVFPVYADSKLASWTLIAESHTDGGSPLAERLGYDFKRAERRTIKIVVGGSYPDLTRDVVIEALERQSGANLSRLMLVVVGAGKYTPELQRAARARRIRFASRDLQCAGGGSSSLWRRLWRSKPVCGS
jgi:hypothetical protein